MPPVSGGSAAVIRTNAGACLCMPWCARSWCTRCALQHAKGGPAFPTGK
ncbi:hypothetical protein SGM_0346 [Streptomyces griseoaurantiacus M045]|uniref:Uncharacterized protein n=1 Tax=Streptomyces griseoaurantiacus M045 TaxID=996637 RepID=F3NAG2_9ACTN|nr:hypothetical protein SGM_0346 [Streptomyces griseoaurantiacus M045]